MRDDRLPLAGLRVVDMADEKAELGGRVLADLGADVIRVEPIEGAASRSIGPFHEGESLYFAVRNANKRTMAVDLGTEAGRSRLVELLAGSDIWIETSPPGTLASLGLDPREVAGRLNELVIVSVTDFGQTGPYRDFVATDAVMEAMAWMVFRAGVPELPPVLPPGAIAYDIAGISAAFAALTAYRHRLVSGTGQWIDLSVMEAVAQTTDWGLATFSVAGGNYAELRNGAGPIYPIVACRDGWVRPSIVTVAEWRKMRSWLGEPAELQDEHFDSTYGRIEMFDDVLRPMLADLFSDMTMIAAAEEGQRRRIPVTPLLRPADVLSAAHFKEVGSFVDARLTPGAPSTKVASGFYVCDGERIGFREPAEAVAERDPPNVAWRSSRRSPASIPGSSGALPYSGTRVLDFGVAGAAPEIARLLGEYGADVIRIEIPSRPDMFRQLGGAGGVGPVFASSSRTKRSFGVAADDDRGRALVERLIAGADVIVENLPPGTMERFGLGHDHVLAVNPDVVMISSQTMGLRGPWREWRGYGANTQPPGGLTYLWSFAEDKQPIGSNVAFPDHVVGRLGAVIAAAHLLAPDGERQRGHHVEIVQTEVGLNLLADLYAKEALEPGSVCPQGNDSHRGAPWGVYPAAGDQRWLVLTCRSDDDWRRLVEALGRPAWVIAEMETVQGRRMHRELIDERISAWTRSRSDRDAVGVLQQHGVPAGYVMYVSDTVTDPQHVARGYAIEIYQPGVGPMLFEGSFFRSDALPGPVTRPAPLFGQHTREIATEVLGLSDEDVDELLSAGVLEQADLAPLEALSPI